MTREAQLTNLKQRLRESESKNVKKNNFFMENQPLSRIRLIKIYKVKKRGNLHTCFKD